MLDLPRRIKARCAARPAVQVPQVCAQALPRAVAAPISWHSVRGVQHTQHEQTPYTHHGRRETYCEFCDCALPDWKRTLTPPCGATAPAVMNVNFDGRTYSFEVKPGPDGYKAFTEAIRRAFSLPQDSELNITFTCDEPTTAPANPGAPVVAKRVYVYVLSPVITLYSLVQARWHSLPPALVRHIVLNAVL